MINFEACASENDTNRIVRLPIVLEAAQTGCIGSLMPLHSISLQTCWKGKTPKIHFITAPIVAYSGTKTPAQSDYALQSSDISTMLVSRGSCR